MRGLLLVVLACTMASVGSAVAQTTPGASPDTAKVILDIAPQDSTGTDTYGTVTNQDPHDIRWYGKDVGFELTFWCDPLNDWMGDGAVGEPPYRVFVNGLPAGAWKGKTRMPEAEKVPGDDVTWRIRFKANGTVRIWLLVIASDGKQAPGDMVTNSNAMVYGAKCGWQWEFDLKTGRVIPKPEF